MNDVHNVGADDGSVPAAARRGNGQLPFGRGPGVKRTVAKLLIRSLILVLAGCAAAGAQDLGTMNPAALPPITNPNDPSVAAKDLFGRKKTPLPLEARSIGY